MRLIDDPKSLEATSAGDPNEVSLPIEANTSVNCSESAEPCQEPIVSTEIDSKQVLTGLNDRLSSYIEKVRSLEHQKTSLLLKLRDAELKQQSYETQCVDYKKSNSELHERIEAINKARFCVELERKKFENQILDLCKASDKNKCALTEVTSHRDLLQEQLEIVESDLKTADSRLCGLERKIADTKHNLAVVLKSNGKLKSKLEAENVLRIQLQERIERELDTYKNLLEREEDRLQIQPQDSLREAKDLAIDSPQDIAKTSSLSLPEDTHQNSIVCRKRRHSLQDDQVDDLIGSNKNQHKNPWFGRCTIM